MQIDGYTPIKKLEVWLHVPSTREDDEGRAIIVPTEEIERQQKTIEKEAHEIGLANILQCVMQGVAEERFPGRGVIVTVPGTPE